MSFPISLAAPAIREGVSHTISAYTQALDAGRLDELVGLFTANGRSTLPAPDTVTAAGHAALRELYAPLVADHPQRHIVMNTVVTQREDGRADATSTLVWINSRDGAWIVELVGTYRDVLVQGDDGQWYFEDRVLTFETL